MMRGFGPRKPKQSRSKGRKHIPFARVSAEIMITATKQIVDSRVFLNDLSPTGVGCFTNTHVDKGENISLVIEQPRHLFVKGQVLWCTPYTMSTKILSQETFKYRVGIKFIFADEEEKAALRKFCDDLYTAKDLG